MAILRVMNHSGDSQVRWDPSRVETGDPEALAAIREAERIFERERAPRARAFRVRRGTPAEPIDRLDPYTDETVIIPPMVGG